MRSKSFVTLLSLTTLSAMLAPTIIANTAITWQAYCMLQGSVLSLLGSYLNE